MVFSVFQYYRKYHWYRSILLNWHFRDSVILKISIFKFSVFRDPELRYFPVFSVFRDPDPRPNLNQLQHTSLVELQSFWCNCCFKWNAKEKWSHKSYRLRDFPSWNVPFWCHCPLKSSRQFRSIRQFSTHSAGTAVQCRFSLTL